MAGPPNVSSSSPFSVEEAEASAAAAAWHSWPCAVCACTFLASPYLALAHFSRALRPLCCHHRQQQQKQKQKKKQQQQQNQKQKQQEQGQEQVRLVYSPAMRKSGGYESDDSREALLLETVLEVPVPEEFYGGDCDSAKENHSSGSHTSSSSWKSSVKHWMKSQLDKASLGCRRVDLQVLLGLLGAPLVPVPLSHQPVASIQNNPTEASTAQYIVQQFIAASGGVKVLNSINTVYAMGSVKMVASQVENNGKISKPRKLKYGEAGCFVFWQMTPEKWSMELVVSGDKLTLGCDGKRVWRQTAWLGAHPCRGPCRSLRRSIQGLDPRSTANLFSKARCIGEKKVDDDGEEEMCFLLKVAADAATLGSRSGSAAQIMKHEVVGYFSQRTGLLLRLEDTMLMRLQSSAGEFDNWETKLESRLGDYRCVDGAVMVAHGGRSLLNLYKYGDGPMSHTRTRMEEAWHIQEAAFNVAGLSGDDFLPPADVHHTKPVTSEAFDLLCSDAHPSRPLHRSNGRNFSKVASVDRQMDALLLQDRAYIAD